MRYLMTVLITEIIWRREEWMSKEQWWNGTERRKSKY